MPFKGQLLSGWKRKGFLLVFCEMRCEDATFLKALDPVPLDASPSVTQHLFHREEVMVCSCENMWYPESMIARHQCLSGSCHRFCSFSTNFREQRPDETNNSSPRWAKKVKTWQLGELQISSRSKLAAKIALSGGFRSAAFLMFQCFFLMFLSWFSK